jgi:hypothetical protein
MALNNLGNRYSEVGMPDRGDATWESVITGAEPLMASFLHMARATYATDGHPEAGSWLAHALDGVGSDRGLTASAHEQARRHRGPDPDCFDRSWRQHAGERLPAWLTVDQTLIDTTFAWIRTETYIAECDYLAGHPELLEPDADPAVADVLLTVSEESADRYAALRQAARQEGVSAAYRPLLLTILGQEFAVADAPIQQAMLVDRRDDLLSETVGAYLHEISGQDGEMSAAALRAGALLDLARAGDADLVFRTLAEPEEFPNLLYTLAVRPNPGGLEPAAIVASTMARTNAEMACALFYFGVATAISGDLDCARSVIGQVRSIDPDQAGTWINELAEIGRQYPDVLQVISALTAPADPPTPPEDPAPGETDDAGG